MKETFTREKGQTWDGDEDFIHYLEEELTEPGHNNWPKFKENYKITIIIETIK